MLKKQSAFLRTSSNEKVTVIKLSKLPSVVGPGGIFKKAFEIKLRWSLSV